MKSKKERQRKNRSMCLNGIRLKSISLATVREKSERSLSPIRDYLNAGPFGDGFFTRICRLKKA
ncbi:hypothetical protein HY772_10065 [Candidatus Woesearchaeota archaeon]|nr:hypothetical protein [Candidatus Woesearchaeota archaeon]